MASLVFLCSNCDQAIRSPKEGILIRGNVYVADPHDRGGLVGNAFPNPADGKVKMSEVKEYAFCQLCFEAMMPWNEAEKATEKNAKSAD